MSLSLIGAGFGRTGTLSLRLALQQLGLAPCYHMLELHRRPDHVAMWQRATDGEAVDWDEIFQGYPAAVDWPTCTFYRELAAHYPNAKVILTVRDPERWFKSITETIFATIQQPLPDGDAALRARRRMQCSLIIERTFGGRVQDRQHVIGTYEQRNETVKRTIAPERLLVFNVAEGWTPLCQFLGLPIPGEPFPQVNSTDEFREMVAAGTQQTINSLGATMR